MKSREVDGIQLTNQAPVTKPYNWFALVKYLRDKIKQTSLALTEILPISDRFIK